MSPQLVRSEQPRLHGQCLRLMQLYLKYPGGWFTLGELVRAIGATSEAGVSARLRQLTGEPYRWVKVKRIRSGNLWEYSLRPPKSAPPQLDLL